MPTPWPKPRPWIPQRTADALAASAPTPMATQAVTAAAIRLTRPLRISGSRFDRNRPFPAAWSYGSTAPRPRSILSKADAIARRRLGYLESEGFDGGVGWQSRLRS